MALTEGEVVSVEREGTCLCGHLRYTVVGELAPVFNCHCHFCRRVHGAAFTTLGYVSSTAIRWHASSGEPSSYRTTTGNDRCFCGRCSTLVYNHAPAIGLACVVVGSLAEDAQPPAWAHINTESKSGHFKISDGLPSFLAWPEPRALRQLARSHAATLPPEMTGFSER